MADAAQCPRKFVFPLVVAWLTLKWLRNREYISQSCSPLPPSSLPVLRWGHITGFQQWNANGNDVVTSGLRWLKSRCSSLTFSFPIQRPDAEAGALTEC